MKARLFTFSFNETGGFDGREMEEFLEGREVVEYQKDFFFYRDRRIFP